MSLQPDGQEGTATGMRQRLTSVMSSPAQRHCKHLYEDVYRQRGQMENPIKLVSRKVDAHAVACPLAS